MLGSFSGQPVGNDLIHFVLRERPPLSTTLFRCGRVLLGVGVLILHFFHVETSI